MSVEYEFNENENKIIGRLVFFLNIVGYCFIINGAIFGMMGYFVGEAFSNLIAGNMAEIHQLLINLIFILIGMTLSAPTDNLKRIITTEGNDIRELMTALKELSSGFNTIVYLFVILLIMQLIVLFI